MTTLYDLNRTYSSEVIKYQSLMLKESAWTTTGNLSFTSQSSGAVYNSTSGEQGLMTLLQSVVAPYMPTASIINGKLDTSNLLNQIKLIDGVGSGIDADLLQGINGSMFSQKLDATPKFIVKPSTSFPVNICYLGIYNNEMYYADTSTGVIYKINLATFVQTNITTSPVICPGYYIDSSGNIWGAYFDTTTYVYKLYKYTGTWNLIYTSTTIGASGATVTNGEVSFVEAQTGVLAVVYSFKINSSNYAIHLLLFNTTNNTQIALTQVYNGTTNNSKLNLEYVPLPNNYAAVTTDVIVVLYKSGVSGSKTTVAYSSIDGTASSYMAFSDWVCIDSLNYSYATKNGVVGYNRASNVLSASWYNDKSVYIIPIPSLITTFIIPHGNIKSIYFVYQGCLFKYDL